MPTNGKGQKQQQQEAELKVTTSLNLSRGNLTLARERTSSKNEQLTTIL